MSWLFKSAKNLHLDFLKSPQNSNLAKAIPLEEVIEDTCPLVGGSQADQNEVLQIQQALKELAPEDRVILLLVDLEEYTYAEAAEIAGISESNLRFKLHHIRKAFAEKYRK